MDKENAGDIVKRAKKSRFDFIIEGLVWLFRKLWPRLQREVQESATQDGGDGVMSAEDEAQDTTQDPDTIASSDAEEGEQMSGVRSRRKGARWERELVHRFREVMPDAEIRRGLQMRSGEEVPDVECPVFWIEAKRGKKPNIRGALRQARGAAPDHRMPIAIVRDDREEATVTLLLDDFLELVEEWWGLRGQ